ncbi:MAG: cyclic nucleotide-binding domain-containing protein [Methylocystaceae bacterium]|nr:cyclic nucleotide-binding domain-containing protein [Methylocystaceae bacterium]
MAAEQASMLSQHAFFKGLAPEVIDLVSSCAQDIEFSAGQYICHEDDQADQFYVLLQGHVALQIASPGRGARTFLTVGAGEVFGVNWLVAPYRWTYDAKALDDTKAVVLNAACLRRKCEADHDLGFELMKRVMPILIERLHVCRIQLLDLYLKQN